jgi:tetratricopeptide (TPR) repeat protein
LRKDEQEFHRKVAAGSFNKAWDLLEKNSRNKEEDQLMLGLAHSSRYHWSLVGTQRNQAVGDWQISRVYAALGQSELALRYAKSSLAACEKNGLGEIIPSAYEAVARAYAVARDSKRADGYLSKARRLLDKVPIGKEDKGVYLGQIEDTQRLIDRLLGAPLRAKGI